MSAFALDAVPPRATTRFAPSPTGVLHLGHVVNAVWTWGVAQATGGRVLLRLEDHDRGRCRPQHERSILADLEWLGLAPDQGIDPLFRQSDHEDRYQAALEALRGDGLVYACRCSRKDIARARVGEPNPAADEVRYAGTCRNLGLAPGPGRGIRLILPDETVSFDDLRLGPTRQTPARQCGDLLLRDPHGNWTYQFCVTVDDRADAVDLVIRGEDILDSTGRQILLARLLGREEPPRYLHHPLVRNDRGVKLSKRDGAEGLAEFRARGLSREALLGLAAFRSGLRPDDRPIGPAELGSLFAR